MSSSLYVSSVPELAESWFNFWETVPSVFSSADKYAAKFCAILCFLRAKKG
jgi:hypothetical protein